MMWVRIQTKHGSQYQPSRADLALLDQTRRLMRERAAATASSR
jgi:hypothetical protein